MPRLHPFRSVAALVLITAALAGLTGCRPGTSDERIPRTDVQQRVVDGLILLTHAPSDASDLSLLVGELRANRFDCMTVDGTVVVLPSDDELLGDGSLRRNGATYAPGEEVRLVGGLSPADPALVAVCGPGSYFFAGSGS